MARRGGSYISVDGKLKPNDKRTAAAEKPQSKARPKKAKKPKKSSKGGSE